MARDFGLPAILYYGDPVAGSGAMVDLGGSEDVNIDLGLAITWGSDSELGGVPDADKVYDHVPQPVVQAALVDGQVTILEALIHNNTKTVDTLGIGDKFVKRTTHSTLFVLPKDEESDGVAAANGFWMPAAVVNAINGMRLGRPPRGAELNAPYNVEWIGAYTATDQTTPTAVAITEDFRMGFFGDPSDISLTWTIA